MVSKYRDILEPPVSIRAPSPVPAIRNNGTSHVSGSPQGEYFKFVFYVIFESPITKHAFVLTSFLCVAYPLSEGSARPLFPQWSHHVYPQFLPGTHPNAVPHHNNYVRHRHSYVKHHYNLNNNHHSHHHNHKIDHRYHRNSIAGHQGK